MPVRVRTTPALSQHQELHHGIWMYQTDLYSEVMLTFRATSLIHTGKPSLYFGTSLLRCITDESPVSYHLDVDRSFFTNR
jgi:hypothetical protein